MGLAFITTAPTGPAQSAGRTEAAQAAKPPRRSSISTTSAVRATSWKPRGANWVRRSGLV